MQIEVSPLYMVHGEGTKFYEVILLKNVAASRYVVVRRWGKMKVANVGGGEIKIEVFGTAHQAQAAADKIAREKRGRDYNTATSSYGLHNTMGAIAKTGIERALKQHYATAHDANLVLNHLNLDEAVPVRTAEDDEVIEEGVSAPTPEPERDADWGSW